jgi:hypothetical protein
MQSRCSYSLHAVHLGFGRHGTNCLFLCRAQGDFYHWATLFNHFDELLERFLSQRKDVHLKFKDDGHDTPFPSASILAILRASAIILENCSNKHLYHSYEVS